MDTSGNIRELRSGESLRQGEVGLSEDEARELLRTEPGRRHERLREIRDPSLEQREREAEMVRRELGNSEARARRKHEKAVAWQSAHKARAARRAERSGR